MPEDEHNRQEVTRTQTEREEIETRYENHVKTRRDEDEMKIRQYA